MAVPAGVLFAILRRCSRDGLPSCEVCGNPLRGERGYDWALHHRRFRDGGHDQDTPQNLLAVHGASNVDLCHGKIHGDKGYAMFNGWAISRHQPDDPADIRVLLGGTRWVFLTEDGEYADA